MVFSIENPYQPSFFIKINKRIKLINILYFIIK